MRPFLKKVILVYLTFIGIDLGLREQLRRVRGGGRHRLQDRRGRLQAIHQPRQGPGERDDFF